MKQYNASNLKNEHNVSAMEYVFLNKMVKTLKYKYDMSTIQGKISSVVAEAVEY